MPDQDCPLCGAPATFANNNDDYGKLKKFTCQNCTEFIITDNAEVKLKKFSQTEKDQYSEKAKAAPEGQILFIRVPDQHQAGVLNPEVLRAEYRSR